MKPLASQMGDKCDNVTSSPNQTPSECAGTQTKPVYQAHTVPKVCVAPGMSLIPKLNVSN